MWVKSQKMKTFAWHLYFVCEYSWFEYEYKYEYWAVEYEYKYIASEY